MGYPIDEKFVVAVASSALFDLSESDEVFREKGEEAYRKYQRAHEENTLEPGVAFPLIKRLLQVNGEDSEDQPVEVVLLSKNDPDTGLRVFKSIEQYGLAISRAVFNTGSNPFPYMQAFNASLFLSANPEDVREAVGRGFPAAQVFPSKYVDNDDELELRIAFDFDGIIADDSSEEIFRVWGIDRFQQYEKLKADEALPAGPLLRFFKEIGRLQRREWTKKQADPTYVSRIRIAIVTARNAPAHERVVTTLRDLGIYVDEAFFLGGIEKERVLKVFRPHIFFDDQVGHIEGVASTFPAALVPFGIAHRVS